MTKVLVAILLLSLQLSATEIFIDLGTKGSHQVIWFNGVEVTKSDLVSQMKGVVESFGKGPVYLRCFKGATVEQLLDATTLLKSFVTSITWIEHPSDGKSERMFKVEVMNDSSKADKAK
jgi:hypothetical protein